ncbi:UNVERIFIED_CONTAM: hypothetical protein Scaly_2867400 [Sesamum calycinum]|uniref:DDE Tnp4 domain-containing protein n=1 Tax=Sesamum calycinum TaxID=2727403 RepID=A0AAW2LCW7_9LAMI
MKEKGEVLRIGPKHSVTPFQGCLGALDGTYIDIRVPADDKALYHTHKGSIAVNVLGVCDRDLNFIYVLSGWEGKIIELFYVAGCYYLRDSGYTNRDGFLTPYRDKFIRQAMPIDPFENMVAENVLSSDGDNVEYLDSVDANPA